MKIPTTPSLVSGALFSGALTAFASLTPLPAVAAVVYRCNGANGETAFTNKPGGMKGCTKVADFADTPVASAKAANSGSTHVAYTSSVPATSADPVEAAISGGAAANVSTAEVRSGAVYKVVHANGTTEYTNVRPGGRSYQVLFTYIGNCYACNVHSTINWTATALNFDAYRAEVASAATEYGVDPALLRAVIHAESAFNPNAVSTAGAQGLMQLMPGTASDLGVNNPFDVSQNIRGGAHYLADMLKQFNGDERLAAAAYNAGPQNVQKYNAVPPFDETRVYVDRVATLRRRYHDSVN